MTLDGIISTFAGGTYGDSGDGGPASQARFQFPNAIAADNAGSVYIADWGTSRLRRVGASGIVNTVAGNGQFRTVPDGTPAALGYFWSPLGLALDNSGNLFVADSSSNRVRKVGSDGAYYTIAGAGARGCCNDGGPARSALLSAPFAVAADSQGNVYIADRDNHRVRKAGPDGNISTFAGNGTAAFAGDGGKASAASINSPSGLAVDASGNVFIGDNGNARVRRVGVDGTITTIAGNGTQGFSGDGGPALNAALNEPNGLAFDAAGNLLVATYRDNRVRKISPSGTITTIAGTGAYASTGDGGPATAAAIAHPVAVGVDSAGSVYVLDNGANRVRRIAPDGRISTIAGTGTAGFSGDGGDATRARLHNPVGMAVDGAGTVYIADSNNDRIGVVRTASASMQVSPGSLDLSAGADGSAVTATVSVTSTALGLPIIVTTEGGAWLSVDNAPTQAPATFNVTANPALLGAGRYSGLVVISSPLAVNQVVRVGVTLIVTGGQSPRLSLSTDALSFRFVEGEASGSVSVRVSNAGGGTLAFAASAISPGNWLSVTPEGGSVTPGAPIPVTITAAPGRLGRGAYSGTVLISGASDRVVIPVTMTVSAPVRSLLVSQSGLTFTAVSGGGAPTPQSIGMLNIGAGSMDWRLSIRTLSGAPGWLRSAQTSGHVERPYLDVSFAELSVDARNLAAGDYYGQVEVFADADNSPQTVTVVLNVLPAGANPGPEVRPAALIFTGVAGRNPGSQDVSIANLGSRPTTYDSSRIGGWFAVVPDKARIAPDQPGRIVVQPDFSSLAPGVQRGAVTVQFQEDGSIRTVNLLTVVAPQGSAAAKDGQRDASSCFSPGLRVEFLSLRTGFAAIVGWPTTVEVRAVDDCGSPVAGRNDTVVANIGGEQQIKLNHIGEGVWTGTWRPVRVQPSAVIQVGAVSIDGNTRRAGVNGVTGSVRDATGVRLPIVTAGGVLHAASFAPGAPIAPGSLITIYGANLAQGAGQPGGLPLPTRLNGAEFVLGGRTLPLLYTSEGQVNAQVPYDMSVNTQQQLLVRLGDVTPSVPEQLTVVAGQPGIFTENQRGFGQAIILKSDQRTLAKSGSPARIGEAIVIYCTGLGAVAPAVQPGVAAPSNPLARTVNPVTLTIGGRSAEVLFAGLTPGYAGLYQVNAIVPQGVTPGAAVSVTLTVAGQTSPAVTMAVQ